MILSAIIALFVGLLQFYMLSVVMKAALNKGWLKAVLFAAVKLILYFVGIYCVLKLFKVYVIAVCIGFGAGFFASIAVYAVKAFKNFKS